MTDQPPAACARDQQHPDQARVSRLRRAAFAFGVTFTVIGVISATIWMKAPPNDVTSTAQHVLADMGTFVGLAYIGGSVVDYSGMFRALGNRFGISIPVQQQQGSN
jgi:hypothetical protein